MDSDDVPWGELNIDHFKVQLLTDPYCSRILAYTSKKPASSQELAYGLDIPIAVCYRRLNEMQSAGLVSVVDRFLNRRGKRVSIYKSMVQVAKIEFIEGQWIATIQMLGGPKYSWVDGELFDDTDDENLNAP